MKNQNNGRETNAVRKKNLVIDLAALCTYLVVANPVITGIALHEWLGLGVFIVFLVHCIVHYDWIVDVIKNGRKSSALPRWGNLALDVLILLCFIVVTVSGLGISGTVLQTLGFYVDGYYVWGPLHSISAKILLALLVIHIAVHWKWFVAFFKRDKDNRDES